MDLSETDISLVGAETGPVSFSVPSVTNVNPVVLELSEPLAADSYTLTITDSVTASAGGLALDGEIADPRRPSSLPSGDGVPGGDAVIEFAAGVVPIPTVSAWGHRSRWTGRRASRYSCWRLCRGSSSWHRRSWSSISA